MCCRHSPEGRRGRGVAQPGVGWARKWPSRSTWVVSDILGDTATNRQFSKIFPHIKLKSILKPKPIPSPWGVLLNTVNPFSQGQTPGTHPGPGQLCGRWGWSIDNNLNLSKKGERRAETLSSQSGYKVAKLRSSYFAALPSPPPRLVE